MPLLWFVYPLNGSGCGYPDAADRGQDSFLLFLLRSRKEAYMRQPANRLIVPRAESFCSDVESKVACNEKYDDHDTNYVKDIHC